MPKVEEQSKYKGVAKIKTTSKSSLPWKGTVGSTSKYFATERDAAKWVDIRMIKTGRDPVNVLIKI